MSAIGGAVGGIVDMVSGSGGDERKAQDEALKKARGNWNYNTQAAGQGGTEFDKMDPTGRNAMMSALGNYESRVNQGGLDAVGRANLEGAKAEAAQNSAQSAAQVQAEAQRRGTGGGAKAQLMQTIAGQQAGQGARQAAFDSAAMAENARNAALAGQTKTAGAVYGMDANRAAAQDAINQFNVQNAQRNIANNAVQAGGRTGVDTQEVNIQGERAKAASSKFANMGSAIGGAAASVVPGGAAFEGVSQAVKGMSSLWSGGGKGDGTPKDYDYGGQS